MGLITGWVAIWENSPGLLMRRSQAGVLINHGSQAGVLINHGSHLYYKYFQWAKISVDLNLISRVFARYTGFLPHQIRFLDSCCFSIHYRLTTSRIIKYEIQGKSIWVRASTRFELSWSTAISFQETMKEKLTRWFEWLSLREYLRLGLFVLQTANTCSSSWPFLSL